MSCPRTYGMKMKDRTFPSTSGIGGMALATWMDCKYSYFCRVLRKIMILLSVTNFYAELCPRHEPSRPFRFLGPIPQSQWLRASSYRRTFRSCVAALCPICSPRKALLLGSYPLKVRWRCRGMIYPRDGG